MVAGGFDYLLKVRVSDMAAYRAFLGGIPAAMPGVRETRTYAVLEEVKATTWLPHPTGFEPLTYAFGRRTSDRPETRPGARTLTARLQVWLRGTSLDGQLRRATSVRVSFLVLGS